jgi:hypothetical protein
MSSRSKIEEEKECFQFHVYEEKKNINKLKDIMNEIYL